MKLSRILDKNIWMTVEAMPLVTSPISLRFSFSWYSFHFLSWAIILISSSTRYVSIFCSTCTAQFVVEARASEILHIK